jgi:hypothetical protein
MSDYTGTEMLTLHEIWAVGDDASAVLAFVDLLNARVEDMKNSVAKLPAEFVVEQEIEGLVTLIDDQLLLTAYIITYALGRTLAEDRVDDFVDRLLDRRPRADEPRLPDSASRVALERVDAKLDLVLEKLDAR